METQNTKNLPIWAGVAAVLAIIFNALFIEKYLGISVFIYGALLLGALFWFSQKNDYSFKSVAGLAALFLLTTAMPSFRANPLLIALDVLGAIMLYLLMIRVVTKEKLTSFGLFDYILTVILWPLKFVGGFFKSVGALITKAKNIPNGKASRVAIGVLTALPVLVFFAVLFSSADLAFRQFLEGIFSFNIPNMFLPRAVVSSIIFVFSLGGFYYLLNPGDKTTSDLQELLGIKGDGNPEKEDRSLEVTVFLSLIAALFLLFIGFQVNYFFGGVANITVGQFTYAEYARKGFAELIVVSISTLIILFVVDRYTAHLTNRKNWFIWPSLFVIAEVMVIMYAAFQRLALYQDAYGLTTLRLYVSSFIVLLAIIFVILAIKFILSKRNSFFAFGVFCSIAAFLVTMNLMNPDRLIAKQNIERFNQSGKIDTYFLLGLSSDAVPYVLDNFNPSTEEDRELFSNYISDKKINLEMQTKHWESFNFSRQKALEELYKR